MNDTVKEWVEKAERDYATAKRELAVVDQPNYDAFASMPNNALKNC
jgi:hypothetical protein